MRGADDEFLKHATPGDTVPAAAVQKALDDWKKVKGRASGGKSDWKPLGPTDAQGLDNEYRDRGVYNAGTPDFSGRIAHVAIDPDCRENGQCTLWIANANGGVWRTNDALDASPKWQYVSSGFEHNNTASIELDPNDKQGRSLYVGTGEPNACGSGCEAGVGIYKSTNARQLVGRPARSRELQQPRRRVDRGQARRLEDDLRRLGPRGPRRLERLLRRRGRPHPGRAALRPLPLDERRRVVGAREPGRSGALHRDATRHRLARRHAVLAPRCAARDDRPGRPEHRLRVVLRPRHLALERQRDDRGRRSSPRSAAGNNERAEFDVVKLPNGATRMYVGVGGGEPLAQFARFMRSDSVRTGAVAAVHDAHERRPGHAGLLEYGYCDPQCSYDYYVYVPPGADADTVVPLRSKPVRRERLRRRAARTAAAVGSLSTNAGVHFTDLTDDTSDQNYPVELHPDHHALVTNPNELEAVLRRGRRRHRPLERRLRRRLG